MELNTTRISYRSLGLGLAAAGILFSPFAYFLLNSVPLAAIGLSAVILGITAFALSRSRPDISPEACLLLFRTGMANSEELFAYLGLHDKAIYLPSSGNQGKPQVIVPLDDANVLRKMNTCLAGRLIVCNIEGTEITGLSIAAPGSIAVEKLEFQIEPDSDQLEDALTHVLTGMFDLANSVRVDIFENIVRVEVDRPELHYEDAPFYRCIGSPVASIAAAVVCEAFGKPVRVKEELFKKRKSYTTLELIG
jgi:hypothetical protein